MENKNYTALVLGANGLIGSHLLPQLIQNTAYRKVYAISRKPIYIQNTKISNIITDIKNADNQITNIHFDHLYICIGTTKKKTPNKIQYREIDHDYPIKVAKIAIKNSCKVVALVSSIGANKNSKNFYLRIKGEVEDSISNLDIESIHIFRPSLLLGKRNEFRLGETIGKFFMKVLSFMFIGKLKKYRSISAKTVSKSMITNVLNKNKGKHIYTFNTIIESS